MKATEERTRATAGDSRHVNERGYNAPTDWRRRRNRQLIWFILPGLLIYAAIVVVPGAQGMFFSITNWDGLSDTWKFVGLANFERLFKDPIAVRTVTNTLIYAALTTVAVNVIGLLLALALNSKIKSRNILRVVFFVPVVILSIVVAYLWKYLFVPDGLATQALRLLGWRDVQPVWLGDPKLVVFSICIIVVWQFSGYAMIIYLAGLQNVPQEQIESAALDGAGPIQRFRYIVLPMLAPAVTVNVLLALVRGLMIFDQVWATTSGGPADSSHSLSTLVYRTAFQFGQLGRAAAISVVLAIIVVALGAIQYRKELGAKEPSR